MASDDQLLATYRHDAHKMRGRAHDNGAERIAGVRVNLDVPYGADADAAALSRPGGKPRQTVDGHETHYRLSLLTGETRYDPDAFAITHYRNQLESLLATDDAEAMHQAWLSADVVAAFNESVYYPYTSLKYHTLLVAALVDCYRDGVTFDDLRLTVDDADTIVPHRTVYSGPTFALRLTDDTGARLGDRPWRSWASTWGRLPSHPFDVADSRHARTVDAQLRRIQAWSTALQFIEDFRAWRPDR